MRILKQISTYLQTTPQIKAMIHLVTILWGGILLLPGNTFASSPAFSGLSLFVHEQVLGSLMCVLGLRLGFYMYTKDLKQQRDALFSLLIVWIFITITIVTSNPWGTSTAIYPTLVYYIFRQYLVTSQQYIRSKQHVIFSD